MRAACVQRETKVREGSIALPGENTLNTTHPSETRSGAFSKRASELPLWADVAISSDQKTARPQYQKDSPNPPTLPRHPSPLIIPAVWSPSSPLMEYRFKHPNEPRSLDSTPETQTRNARAKPLVGTRSIHDRTQLGGPNTSNTATHCRLGNILAENYSLWNIPRFVGSARKIPCPKIWSKKIRALKSASG